MERKVIYSFNRNVMTTLKAADMDVSAVFNSHEVQPSVSFCAAAHPWGDRHITATLDFVENDLHVIYSGSLYPLQRSFDIAQLGGNYGKEDESGKK